ncbi:hypothetical protein QZH41_002523 [Actinostola sp. cb2023]|nr:hypothetical protein QZH41_002523 [Actinostola sp. cb2023]
MRISVVVVVVVVVVLFGFKMTIPTATDTSGSAPHFLLASCGNDNLVRLWNVFTGSAYSEECHLGSRCVLDGHQGPVWDCTFSTNGKILASASNDKTVILWDPVTQSSTITYHYWAYTVGLQHHYIPLLGTILHTMGIHGALDTDAIVIENKDLVASPTKDEPKRKLLAKWSVDEVCSWLNTIGLKEYEESFRNNAIDGVELSNLTMEMLIDDLKIGPVGHRNKILRSVKDVKKEEIDGNIPDEYLCPISREVMIDPVIASDGFSYERNAIESWLRSGRLTSPMSNAPLRNSTLTPNRMLKNLINRHFGQHNKALA